MYWHSLIKLMTTTQTLSEWLGRLGLPREPSSADLLSGNTIIAALTKIIPNYTVRLSLNTTPSARINNWNTVINELEKLGIHVGQQEKSRILNGDEKMVMGLLQEVKAYYERHKEEGDMDISRIDVRGDPKSAKSLLQLFILVIIKYYGFSVKEAVALLSNDSKYLAHILAKGFKEKSKPVEQMIEELITLLPQINVFTKVKENQIFFLKSIKPGLISKFLSISELSLELLVAFTKGISERYQILKNELMPTLILCLRRHACMLGPIIHAIHQIVGHNKNMLTLFLMNASAGEVQLLMLQMVNQCEREGRVNEAFEQFKMSDFTRSCIENMKVSQLFANAGAFLVKVVEHNYNNFSSDSEGLVKIVDSLSSPTFSKKGDNIVHTNIMFALLQQFGRRKNAIAPQILATAVQRYRSTINQDQSQNYLHNFLEVMEYFPSIPTTGIVQAILARYESSTTSIRELELDFLQGSLQGINEKIALRLITNLTKVFIEEFGYIQGISAVICGIIRKFDVKTVFDSAVKFVKVCLSVHYSNLRKLSYSKSLVGGEVKIDKANASLKLKNLEVQRLLDRIVKMKNDRLNDTLEPLICYNFFQSELKSKEASQGIKRVMLLLGTEDDLRKLYEADAKMMLQDTKDAKRKSDSKEKPKVKEEQKMRVNSDASLLTKKRNLFSTLNPPKIALDAQKGLEKYTKNFLEKVGKLSLQEQKRVQQQQRREELRKKMALRMVEQGINISAGKTLSVSCLYEFNSRQKIQNNADYSYLPFYEQQVEDERDVKGLQYFFKRYNRLFRLYYSNYAKLKLDNIKSFDDLSERGGLMRSANVWKLLRDHKLDEGITINQVHFIVQRINAHFKKEYRDSSLLDYPAFENFIIQAALAIYSRPPYDMRSRPISEMTQKIVDRFREHAQEYRIDEKMFEESDPVPNAAKPDQLKELNEKLKNNPDMILPEGYKKQTTKKLCFEYKIHLHSFDEAYADVLEVLDKILNEKMGIHIIEPYSVTYVQAMAKPILYQTINDSVLRERSLSSIFPRESRLLKEAEGDGNGGNLSRVVENKFSKEKKLKEEEKAMKQAEQIKRREQRDREIKAMLEKHRQRQLQIDRKKQQQRKEQQRKADQQRKRKEKYEQELKRKVIQYAEKKRMDKEKQQEQARKRKEEEAKNLQRMKGEMELKRKMIQEARLKKKQQQNARIQKEAAQIKRREEENKIKLLERKDKTIKMLEDYRIKKQKQRGESEQKLKTSQQSQVDIKMPSKPTRIRTPSRLKLTPSREKSTKKIATPAKEIQTEPAIQQSLQKMQLSDVKPINI